MKDPFDYAFEETVGLEGGYSDNPQDRGGRTKFGITEKMFLHALERGIVSGTADIKDLTLAQAKAIYMILFWLPLQLNRVDDTDIAAEIFDTAVNSGVFKAALLAQMALDYLGESLVLDGQLGPKTLTLINKWCMKDPMALFTALNGMQFVHFLLIVDDFDLIEALKKCVTPDEKQTMFARGWTKRVQGYRRTS